jgi:sulfur carrier protein ThiS
MRINLKLFASLSRYLPSGSRENTVELEVAADETVEQVIQRLGLPLQSVHLVLLNGVYLSPEQRIAQKPQAGDQLAIWPPVAGG